MKDLVAGIILRRFHKTQPLSSMYPCEHRGVNKGFIKNSGEKKSMAVTTKDGVCIPKKGLMIYTSQQETRRMLTTPVGRKLLYICTKKRTGWRGRW